MRRRQLTKNLMKWCSKALRTAGMSRHSALPALRRLNRIAPVSKLRQAAFLLLGSVGIGVSVSLLVKANLGLAPYDVMSSALRDRLGITLGQAGWLLAGTLFLVSSILGRRPSLWGISYILANGVAIDASSELLNSPDALAGQIGFVAAGTVLMASAVSLVMYSGTTGGPFELLMLAGEDRGFKRARVRALVDFGVLALGVTLGGSFGVATVAFAATFGIVLQAVGQALLDHQAGRTARQFSELAS